jgi:beta-glucosidase
MFTKKTAQQTVDQRVEAILKKFTLEEKLDYIGGYGGFSIMPVERLGLPEIKMTDGPVGVRQPEPSNAYPATVGLAASWNPELAQRMGTAMGRDCRARGIHILLAPGTNIYRFPLCGRNFEYLGEDPHLAARMVIPLIRGIQSQGVLATVKHFACNNQEYDRHNVSSEVDERTLREIYLPSFHAAVTEARAACVMNSYNLLGGTHATQHDWLNNQLLKGEWGFDGILMSDWLSTYDAVGAVNGGLDIEMPEGAWMNRAKLLPAIKDGRVKEPTIDDKIRRILRTIIKAGFLDRDQRDASIPRYDPFGVKASLDIARESIVLLSNKRSVLPLNRATVKRVAVIGSHAHPKVPNGGGSSYVSPWTQTSILDGMRRVAGDAVEVHFHDGGTGDPTPIFARSTFMHRGADGIVRNGLSAEYFTNTSLTGAPVLTQVDDRVDFDWYTKGRPSWAPSEGFSIRWTGILRTQGPGTARLYMRCDDGMRVWLDGKLVLDDWGQHGARVSSIPLQLRANKDHALKIEYNDLGSGAVAQFGWAFTSGTQESPEVTLAKLCDAVVVCVGFDSSTELEGSDRAFALPAAQRALIEAMCTANRNTVVVLCSGGSVDTSGWGDRIAALLHAFYPGQEGGRAIAEILFGDVNPSGKLPFSFDKALEENPAYPYYGADADKRTHYTEGVFVGYRGYDRKKAPPLFPFGHGLSYTTFVYSELTVARKSSGAISVACEVRNIGKRAGAEVVQVYVRDVKASVERPVKELKAFAKVALKPGQKKRVTVMLKESDLAFYDVRDHRWVVESGEFEVLVGASSRDVRLKEKLRL